MIEFIKAVGPTLMLGIVGAFLYWKKEGGGLGDRLLKNYQTLDDQQKATIVEKDQALLKREADIAELKTSLKRAHEEFLTKMSKADGVILEKDQTIKRQQAIIENKNPELVKILNQNLEINAKVADFMQQLVQRMDASQITLNTQTTILEHQVKREKQIDSQHPIVVTKEEAPTIVK